MGKQDGSSESYGLQPCGDLAEGDIVVKNTKGYTFAVHIVDFRYDGVDYLNTSSFFATQKTTEIELSSFTAKAGYKQVELAWVTETETNNMGFNLYRSEKKHTGYEKINDALIVAKGSDTQGASYKFIDTLLKNRKVYYYKLEDIDKDGTTTEHGP